MSEERVRRRRRCARCKRLFWPWQETDHQYLHDGQLKLLEEKEQDTK